MTNILDQIFSKDMRRFSLRRMLIAVTSLGIGFGLARWFGSWASLLSIGIALFWTGYVVFLISDWCDVRPLQERVWWSKTLNFVGVLLITSAQALIILGTGFLVLLGIGRLVD